MPNLDPPITFARTLFFHALYLTRMHFFAALTFLLAGEYIAISNGAGDRITW